MIKFCLVVAALSAGCGLISSDVTNFDLTLPDKAFSVDAASWEIDDAEAQPLLQTSCTGNETVCASAAQAACPMNCDGECNASTQTCDLSLAVSLYQTVDLLNEKPELQQINDEPVIKVTLQSVTWEVTANTLNTATPPMKVYVAPMSVMDPNSPDAKEIGTIAGVDAGMVTDAPQQIAFTATGRADLIAAMSTFKTPFNVIVGSTITIGQGDSVPQGRLDAVVQIKASAGL
ncbi:MAG: hypothetical protein H0V17_16190 [Deltaproteobacteria bacterium]|nr:hypothetical protein [Deltaproteobacteria bacterium]